MQILKRLPLLILFLISNNLFTMEQGYEDEPSLEECLSTINAHMSNENLLGIIPKKKLRVFEQFNNLPRELRYNILKICVSRILSSITARKMLEILYLVCKAFKADIDFMLVEDKDLAFDVFKYYKMLLKAEIHVKNRPESKINKELISCFGNDSINVNRASFLLRGGANIAIKNEREKDLLSLALWQRDEEMANILLANNILVSLEDTSSASFLEDCIYVENIATLEKLLSYNAIAKSSKSRETPLILAVSCAIVDYESKIIQLLLTYDADPNVQDEDEKHH